MANPGEINQEIGRAYQRVFIAALEGSMRSFENKFEVQREPDKTSFKARTGTQYSFDFSGVQNRPWIRREVLGECKGYTKGAALLGEFRSFLAKAYVTSTDYPRHRDDCFWFVTNVPFACSEGSGLRSPEFIRTSLKDNNNPQVREILGDSHVDDGLLYHLTEKIGVFILTDSFLMNTELSYKVEYGDSLWTILKKFHPGRTLHGFGGFAQEIASKNGLGSPDHITSGKRIRLSWRGIRRSSGEEFGGF